MAIGKRPKRHSSTNSLYRSIMVVPYRMLQEYRQLEMEMDAEDAQPHKHQRTG